jgi:protease secretion system outer membrane protein
VNQHRPRVRRLLKCMAHAALAGALLHGGAASALSLMQAYDAALKNDPAYRAAYYDMEGGKEYRILGRSALLPNLSASYSTSKNRADITAFDILGRESLQHPAYTSKSSLVQLRQPLFSLDALARYKQGVAQTEVTEAAFTGRTQELALRVVTAYIEALFANEQVALSAAQRNTLAEQKRVNDHLFEKGEGTKTDMLETQARLDLAEAQLLEAQDNKANALATLAGVIGADVDSLDGLAPNFRTRPLQPATYDGWKALALANNPDLKAQLAAIEVAHQEVNKGRAGHFPRVDFVGTYSKGESESINTYNQNQTVRSIGVQVNIPLYAGGSVSASTRQAVAAQEKAKADLQAQTDKILIDVRKQYNTMVSSVARIDALVKAVESARLLVTATEQSIKGGVRINLDLLNAQQQLYTSQRDLAQARFTYLTSLLRLRAGAGGLSFDDVREVAAYFR